MITINKSRAQRPFDHPLLKHLMIIKKSSVQRLFDHTVLKHLMITIQKSSAQRLF